MHAFPWFTSRCTGYMTQGNLLTLYVLSSGKQVVIFPTTNGGSEIICTKPFKEYLAWSECSVKATGFVGVVFFFYCS